MPAYSTERTLPYSPKQLYDLVADIESYPDFIPWCEGARIYDKEDGYILADLLIKFKAISGKYTSRVFLDDDNFEISVELVQGPFHHLYQGWKFTPTADGTLVEFDIDFKMRSVIIEKLVQTAFKEACSKVMDAFTKRADETYNA